MSDDPNATLARGHGVVVGGADSTLAGPSQLGGGMVRDGGQRPPIGASWPAAHDPRKLVMVAAALLVFGLSVGGLAGALTGSGSSNGVPRTTSSTTTASAASPVMLPDTTSSSTSSSSTPAPTNVPSTTSSTTRPSTT